MSSVSKRRVCYFYDSDVGAYQLAPVNIYINL